MGTIKTIASLTRKGYSQKKIAKILHIRKTKVVKYQKTHEIGKRSKWGEHIKSVMEMKEISYKEAFVEVKKTPYWARKRLARMSKKQREATKPKDFWKAPVRPKEARERTFIEVEGIMYYV